MMQQELSEESLVGQALGHCCLIEKIGEGGMGVVYRARDEHLKRDVAIKVLPAGALADAATRQRFRKEALALSELNNPNIAVTHDFDSCNDIDYLVEELIPGTSLDDILRLEHSARRNASTSPGKSAAGSRRRMNAASFIATLSRATCASRRTGI